MKPLVRINADGSNQIVLWMFGCSWSLKTTPLNRWLIHSDGWLTKLPLRHPVTGDFISSDCDVITVIEYAQEQILKLRYRVTSYTFHEQHLHLCPSASSLESNN